MVKFQQCDEILSTFMKITRVNKLKNKTKFNTNINNVEMLSAFMKITRVNSGAPDIHFFPVLVWSANGDAPFQGKFPVNLD